MAVGMSMSFSVTGVGDALGTLTVTTSGGTIGHAVDVTVPASTSDSPYPLAIDISELEGMFLYTDGTLTLETNSSSAPQETFTFTSGNPVVWYNGMPGVAVGDLFAGDVTTCFLTNGTAAAVRLRGMLVLSE